MLKIAGKLLQQQELTLSTQNGTKRKHFLQRKRFLEKDAQARKMFISTTKGDGGLEVDSKGATLHASLEVDVNQTFYDGLDCISVCYE